MKIKCAICGKEFEDHHMSHHVVRSHKIKAFLYYLTYISSNASDGKCLSCGKETRFKSINRGYHKFCCSKCSNSFQDKISKTEQSCLNKYGVKNVFLTEEVKLKSKEKHMENLGVDNPSKSEKIKSQKVESMVKNYGENWKNVLRDQREITCFKKYGVRNYNQSWEGIYKSKTTSYKKKPYFLPSGRIIYKQGYEPQFLSHVFVNKILDESDIVYYPKGIKYIAVDGRERYYFPDFVIPKMNLIVECKSTWTIQTDFNLKNKECAVRKVGFNYVCIVNNNFSELDKIISSFSPSYKC